jgi:nitrite reductase/ring-hydroxylating ferredoxin subunit
MSRYRGTGIQEPRVQPSELSRLIARQRPGWTLEQPFYTAAAIYEVERRGWLATQWYLVGHRSELADPGCHIVREILGESLIIVRDEAGALRAFYNVCRHRGSRLCAADGRAARLVCPYHAWAYGLDGGLRSGERADADRCEVDPTQQPVQGTGVVTTRYRPAMTPCIIRRIPINTAFPGVPSHVRRSFPR